MELLIELALQFFGELLFQGLVELGWRGLTSPFERKSTLHPVFVFFTYLILGAISGAVAVWLLPDPMISSPNGRLIHLAVSPILLGFAFELLGRRREKKGRDRLLIDRFSYGFIFAFTFALIRYVFTN